MSLGTLVLGLINGLIIGLLAVGFVLIYKANRFLNLAHAQLGAVSAMLLAKVVNDWHWGFWPSFVGCMTVGIATGLVVERFIVSVVRRRSKSPVRLLMLTIGVGDVLLALTYIPGLTPTSQAPFPQPFASHLEIGGVVLSGMDILTLVAVPLLLVALTVFLEYTTLGKQVRAAASNPDAARLCGISVNRVSLIIWGIAGGLSAISAIFNGPTTTSFNAEAAGPYLLMLTLGAAAIGAFVSIPAAVGGGVALGLVYQIVVAQTTNAGTAELAVFGAILLVILVRGRAIAKVFTIEGAAVPELRGVRMPASLRESIGIRWAPRGFLVAALLVAALFPVLPYFSHPGNQFLLLLVLIYALIGVALTILVGWAGQVSLGSIAVVGIGAFLTARWAGHSGWNVVDMVIVTGLAGAAVSVVIGLPALRIRGVTLAVVTLGFAVIAPDWLFQQQWLGGSTPFTTVVSPTVVLPGVGHLDTALDLYYVVLVMLVLVVAAGRSLRKSAAGRVIIAVRDNERASSAFGIRPGTVKLRVFALTGFIAASAGVFWALAWQSISPAQFPADASIAVLALPVIGGIGSLGGAVAAAVLLYMGTFFVGPHVSGLLGSLGQNAGFLLLIAGLGVVGSMIGYPNGLAGAAQERWQAYVNRRVAKQAVVDALTTATEMSRERHTDPKSATVIRVPLVVRASFGKVPMGTTRRVRGHGSEVGSTTPLEIEDVAVHFGGITALNGASAKVESGEIVGLIGPNGAGKTTLMNVISGFIRPAGGSVRLFGTEVASLPPEVRAELGVARSFQDATLFPGLTVLETVQVALGHRSQPRLLPAMAGAPWVRAAENESRRQALEIVRSFGLESWAQSLTVELSTGLRRICDLMVQVSAGPRLLLLDEPTAGVAQREAESFGPLVRSIRDTLGCAILIIEHDMPLLMGLCDRVYALEAGQVIAEGTPEQVRNDPAVIASYLGANAAATNRSDAARPMPYSRVPSKQGGSA
jgi:ABC-type branched-subunit amino acid transport system ATPase component/ABC-type branched-subunit amino acid transport system permease subunit